MSSNLLIVFDRQYLFVVRVRLQGFPGTPDFCILGRSRAETPPLKERLDHTNLLGVLEPTRSSNQPEQLGVQSWAKQRASTGDWACPRAL